jgi:hypothetical protein
MIENLDLMDDDHTVLVMSSKRGDMSSIGSPGNLSIRFIEESENNQISSNVIVHPE